MNIRPKKKTQMDKYTFTGSPTTVPPSVSPTDSVRRRPDKIISLCVNLQPPRENSDTRSPLGPRRRKGMFLGSNSR